MQREVIAAQRLLLLLVPPMGPVSCRSAAKIYDENNTWIYLLERILLLFALASSKVIGVIPKSASCS